MNILFDSGVHELYSIYNIDKEYVNNLLKEKNIPILEDNVTEKAAEKYYELIKEEFKRKLMEDKELEFGIYHYTLQKFPI